MRFLGSLTRSAQASLLVVLVVLSSTAGCRGKRTKSQGPATSAAASALPLDHLAPGELAEGKTSVYGFPVPVGLEVESRLPDRTYLYGRLPPEDVANYVRQHVVVSHVEIGAARTLFPATRFSAGAPDRLYSVEVLPEGTGTRLVIKDVTPPPPPPPGLSDADRWRAAGMSPDGRPLDPKKLE